MKIIKALISVSDKTNLKLLLNCLKKYKIKLISSGGTCKKIRSLGYKCQEVSEYTRSPEILNGRVKTLHPKIYAGILSKKNNKSHKKDLKKQNFEHIDLIIVNFYPFHEKIKKNNNLKKIIENIDIGGPTLVRAAAKNFKNVSIITAKSDYASLIKELHKYNGGTSLQFREQMASKAFNLTAYYDSIISNWFNEKYDLGDEILKFLATEISTSIREMVGGLNRILAFSKINKKVPTIYQCKSILKDFIFLNNNQINVENIQNLVAAHFNLNLQEMLSPRRSRSLARPRQIAMYLAKSITSRSLPEIGRKFGGRDHTTVMHAVKKIEELKHQDNNFNEDIELLKRLIDS